MNDTQAVSWLKAHEKLIIVVLGIAAFVFLARTWLDHYYDVAKTAVTTTATTLTTQQDENKKLEQNYSDLIQKFNQTVSQLQTQNTQLASQAASAAQQSINQQALDAKLNNQQLAQKIEQLANQKNVQSTDQGVTLNHDQTVGVTQQLEDVPTLKLELLSEQQINANDIQQIAGLNTEMDSCNSINTGLSKQIVDQKKADAAELKKAKIASSKGKLKWFGIGFISGFVTGHVW